MESIERRDSSDDRIDYERLYEKAVSERDPGLAYKVLVGSHTDDKQRANLIETIANGDDADTAAATLQFDLMINPHQRGQLVRIVADHGTPLSALDALRSHNMLTVEERKSLVSAINRGDNQWAKDVATRFLKGDFQERR